MRMFCLAPSQIEETWEDYKHLLERFAEQTGEITPEQVKDGALEATYQIWGLQDDEGVRGLCVTEIISTARGRVCVLRVVVGDASVGLQARLLDEIGNWARTAIGCVAVRLIGRKGWLRRFKCFRQTGVVAEWNLRTN